MFLYVLIQYFVKRVLFSCFVENNLLPCILFFLVINITQYRYDCSFSLIFQGLREIQDIDDKPESVPHRDIFS